MENSKKGIRSADFKKVSVLIALIFWTMNLFAQTTINIRVTDLFRRPAQGVTITFEDSQKQVCLYGITDRQGRVSFQVNKIPDMVFAFDARENPLYGTTCIIINQSMNEYTMIIPNFPRNEGELSRQTNNIYETIRKYYGYYSSIDWVQKGLRGIGTPGPALGVPGLFSINFLPKIEGGKAYLELSGTLADFIFKIYYNFNRRIGTITGNDVIFQYSWDGRPYY